MSDDIRERYRRAVSLTAPKLSATTPGLAVEGYWIGERHYYFVADRFVPALGRLVGEPAIADCVTHEVSPVLALENLATLLSESVGRVVDLAALADAEFALPRAGILAITLAGQEHIVDVSSRRVIEWRSALAMPALYSPDGRYACFVKGHDLWLHERDKNEQRPLTCDGAPHFSYGRQPDICLGAVTYAKRPSPVALWSPDSEWLLTHRIDERAVPEIALVENAPPGGGRPVLHRYKYCAPGDPLPIATVVAIHIQTGRVVSFDDFPVQLVVAGSPFTGRMVWFGAHGKAFALRMDRHFKRAELIEFDLSAGSGRIVMCETTDTGYLELHHLLGVTPNVRTLNSGEIVWFSERDGRAHLYLHDGATGRQMNRITSGEWLVRDVVHVDEAKRTIIFTACGVDPRVDPVLRSLCRVNLDGSGFEVLLAHGGDIAMPRTEPAGLEQSRAFCPPYAQPGASPDGRFGVVRLTHVERGNVTRIVDLQSGRSFDIANAYPGRDEVLVRSFTALAADGTTRLHGTMFLPSDFDENGKYPLVDYIYPGPQTNVHPQSFHSIGAAHATVLAELGMVSFMLDTRGMPFRTKAIRQAGYGDLALASIEDHVAVVRQLCERHEFLDRTRVAIYGQSGGGYAAARALFEHGDVFTVGVSVCGNHDSSCYSAAWADKYRGPDNLDAFAGQASAASAHKLEGKLLLISGDMDENVHVSQTLTVVDALVNANRDFELLIVPNEGHLLLMRNGYVQRRIWDFLVRNLLGATPPAGFAIEYQPHELLRMNKAWIWEWRS
ncbi:S9 family peptidase [Steroidobacter sp.]|uniref:S9 family peptidase n=1 Tax=Steroidobacter sp. TaxID=1978227 RepID=UPI0025E48287|nr:DPP IV N-terminal domain-containing protein [Steroidobacter sp.]